MGTLQVSFRGQKVNIPLAPNTRVLDVKLHVSSLAAESNILPGDIKLIFKGKIFSDDAVDLHDYLGGQSSESAKPRVYKLMAMGISAREEKLQKEKHASGIRNAPRIRDDMTESGRAEIARRQRLGRQMLSKMASKDKSSQPQYKFHDIQILSGLPEQEKAREILTSLANDPGVLACLAKHEWNVGCLRELFPEGEIADGDTIILGLNKNKGQEISLRLRTDDLKGFRKILKIKQTLYHELAHNVHSEHDQKFYQLMRQVEKDCTELHWSQNGGHGLGGASSNVVEMDVEHSDTYQGGTYQLGGSNSNYHDQLSARQLASQAALLRLNRKRDNREKDDDKA